MVASPTKHRCFDERPWRCCAKHAEISRSHSSNSASYTSSNTRDSTIALATVTERQAFLASRAWPVFKDVVFVHSDCGARERYMEFH